jgi:hypothetical protein
MFGKRLLVLNRYISLFWGRAECMLCDCLMCLTFVQFTNDDGSTSDCSADLVCCSLLLKLDVVVGTLNSCIFCVHYGSTIWVYTMWMTRWPWKTVLMVHLIMVICIVTLHYIHISLIYQFALWLWMWNLSYIIIRVIVTHRTHSLTLWCPSPSEARSLPTCCVSHTRAQLIPIYSCMYYNIVVLNFGLGCMEAFTEQPCIWCCHLRILFVLFKKKKNHSQSAVYSRVVDCSSCCRCVVHVDFRIFQK